MLVSREKKFLFIHIQKTGGTSMSKFFKSNILDIEDYLKPHSPFTLVQEPDYYHYYKVAFTRNPFDRLVSWYSMIIKKKNVCASVENMKNTIHKQVLMNSSTFSEFIFNCEHIRSNSGWKPFHNNQLDYITDTEGKVAVDYIGKFEYLEKDMKKITEYLKLDKTELPHINRSTHTAYHHYYTDETKKIIAKRFERDLDYFKYTF